MSTPATSTELLLGLVFILPLISFAFNIIINERYSWVVNIISPLLLLISACLSLSLFLSPENITLYYTWFHINHVQVDFTLQLNALSRIMLLVVTTVSFLVHLYSTGYMAGDAGIKRYFAMLGFFTFAMLGVVLAGNLILLFIFWELVGFSSYLLIGHWHDKPAVARAAQKAFLYNRIGDAAFLVGIMLIWSNTQSLSLDGLTTVSSFSGWQTAAGLCIFGGVIGKSAQLPLFSWLPDAMEGPTPVSALLHAATMVAAGIFVLVRIFPFFTEVTLTVVALTGIITAMVAATCALHQFDLKKILAYSTISQLGLMVTAVGVGAKDAALLHLFTHAFFKAGLFLAAGSIIHVVHQHQQQIKNHFDPQDIRNLGGLRKTLPITFLTFCISGASLAGIPLFAGFLSKDSIITASWTWAGNSLSWKWIVVIGLFIVSFLTVLYTFRMIWFTFFGKNTLLTVRESPWVMRAPLVILAAASTWLIVSFNPVNAEGWFTQHFTGIQHTYSISIFSAGWVMLALGAAWFVYANKPLPQINTLLQQGFGIDTVYQKTIGTFVLKLSALSETTDRKWIDGSIHVMAYAQVGFAHVIAWFDKYIIDGIVNLGAWLAGAVGSFTRSFQGGKIQLYIFWTVFALIIFLIFVLI